jgi:hypothetical protein
MFFTALRRYLAVQDVLRRIRAGVRERTAKKEAWIMLPHIAPRSCMKCFAFPIS